ncbi:hypothetical protein N2152v2_005499 [Parachlorella kessleri]
MLAVVTSSATTNLQDIVSSVQSHGIPFDQVTLATNSACLERDALVSGFHTILSVGKPGDHTVELLGVLAAALRPGGLLIVKKEGTLELAQIEALKKNLLLSGLVVGDTLPDGQGTAVQARKPQWETGAKAAIKLKPRSGAAAATAAPAVQQAVPSKAWVVSADDEDVEEVLDEEELLTEEDKQRPNPALTNDDCEAGAASRKACKNCTCGRAEEGPNAPPAQLTKDMLQNPTSGCGSCGLGDAFRCGGCPYRGLPSFEMGKPIQLPTGFLAVDI